MKLNLLLIAPLLVAGALAQKSSTHATREQCGHDCHCLRRTFEIQQEHSDACTKRFPDHQTNTTEQQGWLACMAAEPQHCEIVKDRVGKYPHPYLPCDPDDKDCEPTPGSGTNGSAASGAAMDVRCSAACKVHDCRCNDGPVCLDVP